MIWFLTASTLVLAAALRLPQGRARRRGLEAGVLLVMALPVLRWLLEACDVPAITDTLSGPRGEAEALIAKQALIAVWVAGVATGVVRLARQVAAVRRLARESVALTPEARARACGILGLTKSEAERRFRQCGRVSSPLVLPTYPAIVILPVSWDEWHPRLQTAALKHEWHHVRQGDAWWQAGMRLFRVALWFHPLAWKVAAAWADECEAGADRAAVGAGDAADYCSDLLYLRSTLNRPVAMALGFFNGGGSRLSRRIERLLRTPAAAGERIVELKLLLLLALAVGCAWIGTRRAQEADLREEAQVRLSAEAFPADL